MNSFFSVISLTSQKFKVIYILKNETSLNYINYYNSFISLISHILRVVYILISWVYKEGGILRKSCEVVKSGFFVNFCELTSQGVSS